MITVELDLVNTIETTDIPGEKEIHRWIEHALQHCYDKSAEVAVRIVSAAEIKQLNNDYRQKDKPTNILSFPLSFDDCPEPVFLGDLVICPEVLEIEAIQQKKACWDHWAHIVIHGTLHLLGYDHIVADQADAMEALEIKLLAQLNIPNPYGEISPHER